MIPKIIRSTDVGAPTLNGTDGSAISVLDWALVDGPDPLGWTKPFTNTATKGVYRNNSISGTGYYLRVEDAAANHAADARRCALSYFSSMSDIDTGTDVAPSTGEAYWIKSEDLDSAAKAWTIIGTDKWFFFLPQYDAATASNSGFRVWGAGDYIPLHAADPAPFCALWTTETSTTSTSQADWQDVVFSGNPSASATIQGGLAFNFVGTISGRDFALYSVPALGSAAGSDEPGSTGTYPSQNGDIPVSKIHIVDADDVTADRTYRGYLPGLLNPLVDLRPSNPSQTDFAIFDDVPGIDNGSSTVTAKLIPFTDRFDFDQLNACFLIDTQSDWDNF